MCFFIVVFFDLHTNDTTNRDLWNAIRAETVENLIELSF